MKTNRWFYPVGLIIIFSAAGPVEGDVNTRESRPVIAKVEIRVDGMPDEKKMGDLVAVKEGDAYSPKHIRDAVLHLHRTGLFSDIRVYESGGDKVILTFVLQRKLLTRNIQFLGEEKVAWKKLRGNLNSLRSGASFFEDRIERAEEELKELLRNNGCFNAEIRTSVQKDVKAAAVDVVFEIVAAERYAIKTLKLVGDHVLPTKELKESVKSRDGQAYVPALLEQDVGRLKALYHSHGYRRVEVRVEEKDWDEAGRFVSLDLVVTPYEKIVIEVRGTKVPPDLLSPIWEEGVFEEWGLVEGEARILAFLRRKGYVFASVRSSIEKTGAGLRVLYDVDPGEKFRIREVAFEGQKNITSGELKRELGIADRLLFFGVMDGERVFELPREVELFYRTRGFPGAKANLNFARQGRKLGAVIRVEEGERQSIQRIILEGAEAFPQEILRAQLASREGGPFFPPAVQRDVEKLEAYYLNHGRRGTRVSVAVEKEEDNLFSLRFGISEGRKVRVGRVIIAGNVVTRKSAILRELSVKEGDEASSESILQTKRNLERLGIFSEVNIEEVPVSPDVVNLILSLREGERNYAGVGVGLETKSEPRTFAIWDNIIRLRGTAEVTRTNLFGTASQLSFVTQLSLKETRGVLSWEHPYFFGLPVQTYQNAWLEREERKSFAFDQRGLSLTGIKQLPRSQVLLCSLRWARTVLTHLEIQESEVDRQYFPFSATSVTGSFIRDWRNDSFNPEGGYFFSAVAEWAYPLFRAESDFIKMFLKYQGFLPVSPGLNFNMTFRLGLGRGRIPIHERFFGGGSNSFRGEEFDELGPKDSFSGKPVGGKALVLFNFELKFPVVSGLRDLSGAVFCDLGNVFSKRSEFDLYKFKGALGLGVRYRTPLGPLRFDLAWNLHAPERKGRPLVFITIGHVF